jgi:hypothetical protein
LLRDIKNIEGFAIGAADGVLGHVRNWYFDDESWVLRYFVIETGTWHANRLTLISATVMGVPDWSAKQVPASITQEQIKNGPDARLQRHSSPESSEARRQNDLHLRSANDVMQYDVRATDGDIGQVQGLLVEEKTWAIRYVIVDTSNWWFRQSVLIAPEWIDDVHWADSKLMVDLTRQSVKEAPEYDPTAMVSREHEKILHAHYGYSGYWPIESASPGDTAIG